MVPTQVQRTLVKSPPELWAELSDPAALARHLGELGEIRITRLVPERKVEWAAARASGTVRIDPSGWGTRVTLTASEVLGESPPPAPTPQPGEPAAGEPAAGVPATGEPAARLPATATQPPQTPQREAEASGSEVRASLQAPPAASSPDPLPAPAATKPPALEDLPAEDLPAEVLRAEDLPADDLPARPEPQSGTSGGFFARLLGRLRGPEPVYELPRPAARPSEAEADLATSDTLAPQEQSASAAQPPDAPRDAPAPGERSLGAPEPPAAPTPPPAASHTPEPQGCSCDDAPATAPPRSHTPGPHEALRGPAPAAPVPPRPPAAIPETDSREPEPAVADVLRSALDSLGAAHHRPFSRA